MSVHGDAVYEELVGALGARGEQERRAERYLEVRAGVERHNRQRGRSYSLAPNEMAVWLAHELERRFQPLRLPTDPMDAQQEPHMPWLRTAGNTDRAHSWPSADAPPAVDWSGAGNPLLRSVVPAVRNQGMCGSCWAFTTIGSAEASIHIAEGRPPPPLSVQELVDCDAESNRGCLGGNPILAYDYVISRGVASWAEYPYAEGKSDCRRRALEPRAKIDGFLLIQPLDEAGLRRFVAMAPVSVGICGTDFPFMFYAGGVYDKKDCCTALNHAVLIVGYGSDEATGLDFWLLQNSWGARWGEGGFMRILRTGDRGPGLCGLASSPTMALGGRILSSGNASAEDVIRDVLVRTNSWLDSHWKPLMVLFALLLIGSAVGTFVEALRRRQRSRYQASASDGTTASYGAVADAYVRA